VENTASGNAVCRAHYRDMTISGGAVLATTGYAVYQSYGGTTLTGGVLFAYGNAVNEVINIGYTTTSNPAIIAWNQAAGNTEYTALSSTDIIKAPSSTIATWDLSGGIHYANGTNTGFIPIDGITVNEISSSSSSDVAQSSSSGTGDGSSSSGDVAQSSSSGTDVGSSSSGDVVTPSSSSNGEIPSSSSDSETPIRLPQIATGSLHMQTTTNVIMLENLPSNAKVQAYNLQDKQIYSAYPENPKILRIGVQTKGIYVVKISHGSEKQILRVAVR